MPGWLVHMEMERDAEAWIGRAIRWGWVGEAIGWTRQLLRDVSSTTLPNGIGKDTTNE
jgi:nuclear pore complex protein Nup160